MVKKPDCLPDTDVVLRYLLGDDQEQFARAETFFERVRNGGERVFLSEGVLVECLYVLTKHYHVARDEAAQALAGLLLYKGVVNTDREILANGLKTFAAEGLDPVDCFLLARARHGGLRIFSFDKKLNTAAGKALSRREG